MSLFFLLKQSGKIRQRAKKPAPHEVCSTKPRPTEKRNLSPCSRKENDLVSTSIVIRTLYGAKVSV